MFCNFSYRQDKGALEGLKKDRKTIFQRIRQRQGCEDKQALCLYTAGRRRRRKELTLLIILLTLLHTPYVFCLVNTTSEVSGQNLSCRIFLIYE